MAVVLATVLCLLAGPAVGSAAAGPPENNFPPEVRGNPAVGERVVCGVGSWSGEINNNPPSEGFSYQWLRDGTVVGTEVTYRIATADQGHEIYCVVTATNKAGSTAADSFNGLLIPGVAESAPENKVPPKVSGTAAVGQTATCEPGTWSGVPTPTYSYQWLRDGSEIASATGSTYVVMEKDAGHKLSCKVKASNSKGFEYKLSSNSLEIPGSAPKSIEKPRILGSGGPPFKVGEQLTCYEGMWSGSTTITFTYQWLRDGSSIPSAIGSTYTVAVEDETHNLSCRVTATNGVGSGEEASEPVKVGGSKPENQESPKITGTALVGDTLTCEPGAWSGVPTPTYSYVWQRGITKVGSESTYKVEPADRGEELTCIVTATNTEGHASQASAPVVVPKGTGVGKPKYEPGTPPELSAAGGTAVGDVLSCEHGVWGGTKPITFKYQWLRDKQNIVTATEPAYTIEAADQGHELTCKVIAVNGEGTESAETSGLSIPGTAPLNTAAPEVAGSPVVGETLACKEGAWTGAPPPEFKYQWLRDGASIASATTNSYVVAAEDRGHELSCTVTAHNVEGNVPASSAPVYIPGSLPLSTAAPEVSGTPAVNESLTCERGQWSGAPSPEYKYQWLLEGESIESATGSTYTVRASDRGYSLACEVTATNRVGTESAKSRPFHIPGIRPEVIEEPTVSGRASVGAPLTCSPGIWSAKPPPVFKYQWQRDRTNIASATSSSYTVGAGDEGHLITCTVTATNIEGGAEVESSNGLVIPRPAVKTETRQEEETFTGSETLTEAQIIATLRSQVGRPRPAARIASLRKTGHYAIIFVAPAAGTLEVFWYQVSKGARHGAKSKQILLASAKASYARATTQTVTLHLTKAGRRLIGHVKITVKGVFSLPRRRPVTWLGQLQLSLPLK